MIVSKLFDYLFKTQFPEEIDAKIGEISREILLIHESCLQHIWQQTHGLTVSDNQNFKDSKQWVVIEEKIDDMFDNFNKTLTLTNEKLSNSQVPQLSQSSIQDAQLKKKEQMDSIRKNQKLFDYYKIFCTSFNQIYTAQLVIANGNVQVDGSNAVVSALTSACKAIPIFGSVFEIFRGGFEALNTKMKKDNAAVIQQIAVDTRTLNKIIDQTAVKLCLEDSEKAKTIMTAEEQPLGYWRRKFEGIKSAITVNVFDNVQKKMAFSDVSKVMIDILKANQNYQNKSNEELVTLFIKVIKRKEVEETKSTCTQVCLIF